MKELHIQRNITVPIVACLIFLIAGHTAQARDDWQYWGTFTVNHAITERNGLSLLYEVYAKDNMSDDYVYLAIPTYKRVIGQGFSFLGGGYFESVQKDPNNWNNVRSVFLGPVYQLIPHPKWIIESQVKFYYQLAPSREWDYYRPRLSISHKLGTFTLSAEDEMRVDLTNERETKFFRNRVFVTGTKKLNDSLSVGLGYIRQSDKVDNRWRSINALHSVLTYTIK